MYPRDTPPVRNSYILTEPTIIHNPFTASTKHVQYLHMEDKEEQQTLDGIRIVETPRVRPPKVNPFAVLGIVLGTFILSVAFAFGLQWYEAHSVITANEAYPTATTSVPNEPLPKPKPVQKRFPDYTFTADIPSEWRESAEYSTTPRTLQSTLYTYEQRMTPCRTVYGQIETAVHASESIQAQESLNVLRNKSLVTRAEYYTLPAGTTTPVSQDVVQAYYPLYYDNGSSDDTRNVWMLYTNDASPIPDECERSFLIFLSSLHPEFQEYALSKNDTGTLFIEQHEELGSVLLYRPLDTQLTYHITTLASGDIFKPTLVGDTLYYVNTEGFLYAYPLVTRVAPTRVPFAMATDESVNDFIVKDTTIHALTGMWCHDDDDTVCDLTHRTYDLTTQTETVLEEGLTLPLLPTSETPTTSSAISFTQGTLEAEQDTLGGFTTARKLILLSL
jgi:hypothetical protein